jgi:hypothetical protein
MKHKLLPVSLLLALMVPSARADLAISTFKMRPPAATARPAATAQSRLEAVQTALTQAHAALAGLPAASRNPGFEIASAALARAQGDTAAALAWLKVHPEADTLPNGPAPAEKLSVRPLALGSLSSAPSLNYLTALEGLNVALNQLLNNPDLAYRGPVLGALGGYRGKIMDAIGESAVAVREAIHTDLARREADRVAQQRAEQAARASVERGLLEKAVAHLKAHPAKPDANWTADQAHVEEMADHYQVAFVGNLPGTRGVGTPIVLIDKKSHEVIRVELTQ